jgi:hypothetical protein
MTRSRWLPSGIGALPGPVSSMAQPPGSTYGMNAVRDLSQMLAQLRPRLRPGRYVVTTWPVSRSLA